MSFLSNAILNVNLILLVRNMSCVIMLKLRESVASCCILQTLCTANTNSSDMQVVGNRADRTSECCKL